MRIKRTLLFVILLLLVLPAVQKRFHPVSSRPLNGVFANAAKPVFSCSAWMTGQFQDACTRYLEDHTGFRPDLVRLYNQVDFSFFSLPHAERVVIGKNHELFASGYIRGYLGQDFPGNRYIDEKVKMLRYLQEYLWKEKHIFVVVVIPPDKGSFYPECIPGRFLKVKRHQAARDYFLQKAGKAGINILDFNSWFLAMKGTSPYRLIPTTGVHWSEYGAWLSADSATRYLERMTGCTMPRMVLDSVVTSTHPRHKDDDINKTMNLVWNAPHARLAYPAFHFVSGKTMSKPSALFVADSFFWGWWDQPIIQNLFRNPEIWYYDQEIYPESFTRTKHTWEAGLRETVERQDIIVLLQVGAGGGNPGSGIIDRLFAEFDTSAGNPIRKIERTMLSDTAWLAAEKRKSAERNLPLPVMMRSDAISLFNDDLKRK